MGRRSVFDEVQFKRDRKQNKLLFKKIESNPNFHKYVSMGNGFYEFDIVNFLKDEAGIDILDHPKKDTNDEGFLYLLECEGFFKIGHSYVSAESRISSMKVGNPFDIKLIGYVKIEKPNKSETFWHKYFSEKRHSGEWFNLERHEVMAILMFMESENGYTSKEYLYGDEELKEEDGLCFDIYLKMSIGDFKKKNGVDNLSEILSDSDILKLKCLQQIDESLIDLGLEFQDRKEKLSGYYNKKLLDL